MRALCVHWVVSHLRRRLNHYDLGEQYFSRGSADDELAYNLGPILKATQHDSFVEFFRHNNRIARHQVRHVETVHQESMVIVIANRGPISAYDKCVAPVTITGGAAGKPQVIRERLSWLEDE
jgi:hypothetical protein